MNTLKKLIIYCIIQGVLCREFSIRLPESVEALRGLCVLIPCRFDFEEQYDADLQNNPTGIWLKGGTDHYNNEVFNSKTRVNKIKGKIIGDLLMKNCTTIFYNISARESGVYYFRIEASGPLKYTFSTTSVSIGVRDSPIRPSITLYQEDQGMVEDRNEVLEGTSVTLLCSAPSPPCVFNLPTFTWNFLPEDRNQGQNHNTSFSYSQLNFNASHLHQRLEFTCTVTYQLQNQNQSAHSSLILHVLYGPKNMFVSASPSASVLLGSSVSLNCSSDANPAVLNYTWYRENREQIGTGNHLTINTTDSTHSGLYYCRAQNQHGHHNSSLYLDVQYGPRNTSVSASPSASVLLGSSVSLSCSSDANPAVLNYTWYRENQEQIGTGNHLTINTTDSTHSGLYYCRTQNQHGHHNSSLYLDIQYVPQISPLSHCNSTQDLITCSCEAAGNPSPKLEWRLSTQNPFTTKEESVSKTTLRSFISVRLSDGFTLQCVGTNRLGIDTQIFYFRKVDSHSDKGVTSLLIGAAVGASVMMMMWGIFLCVRKVKSSRSGHGDTAQLVLNDRAVGREEDGGSVNVNRQVSSESLHYSTVMFLNRGGSEVKGDSSLTADYSTVQHRSELQNKAGITEAGSKETEPDQRKLSDGSQDPYAQVKPRKREEEE